MKPDEAPWYEAERRQRHHDIVCIVLKGLIEVAASVGNGAKLDLDHVKVLAFKTADDFYPPPPKREI